MALHGLHTIYKANQTDEEANFAALITMLKLVMDQLVSDGVCTEIACYNNGSGWDYYDGSNPVGYDGFLVYRFPISAARPDWFYEVLFEWHDGYYGGLWDDTGENWTPSLIADGDGTNWYHIGVQACVAFNSSDVCVSGWTGTTNFDMADHKGAVSGTVEAVWAAPSGGVVHVWPRSNDVGGSHATYKQNCTPCFSKYVSDLDLDRQQALHIGVSDGDSFFIAFAPGDRAWVDGWLLLTMLVAPDPPAGEDPISYAVPGCPLLMVAGTADSVSFVYDYGTAAGSNDRGGGVIDPSDGHVHGFQLRSDLKKMFDLLPDYSPNAAYTGTVYEEFALWVECDEAVDSFLGFLDPSFARVLYDVPYQTTFNTKARVTFPSDTAESLALSTPWDGVSDPTAAGTATGTAF